MSREPPTGLSRRRFLIGLAAAGAGLTLAVRLSGSGERLTALGRAAAAEANVDPDQAVLEPNAFVRIGTDDRVTVIVKHLEMGQGTYTGLATLVAEELDARWDQVEIEPAPADASRYNNLLWGDLQGTGGSTAIANSFEQMRTAGAVARAMLVAAAAQRWKLEEDAIEVRDGVLHHPPSGRRASFGALAALAARQPVPEQVFLKDPEEFRLIGRHVPRKDGRAKVDGTAVFTQDVKLPGMLTALVLHPPRFGATLKSLDAGAAKAVAGVASVIRIPTGVAVLANDFWSAKKGRDALRVQWDESAAFELGSEQLVGQYRELGERPGAVARNDGDVEQALAAAARRVGANCVLPYLAHAAMEPLNCVIRRTGDGIEIWNGEQYQTPDQAAVADVFGIAPGQVKINMVYAGGSFGRRANPHSDYLVEAAQILRATDGKAPVKLVWTREDDMRAGYYRPMFYHRLEAGLDAEGWPVAWHQRIVGQSIAAGTAMEGAMVTDGIDAASVEGVVDLAYAVPNLRVELHTPRLPVPVQWWRSVGHSHTAFAVETFIDQLAAAAGRDPVEYRRALLEDRPRHRGVLDLAADRAGWGTPLPPGRGRGIAVHASFNSFVAQVAEVTVREDHSFSVDRVVIAVDCGLAVNPDVVVAQMEGGMGFGLSPVLGSEISFEGGRVVQSNFDGYQVLRMDQMPRVEVHIVPSTDSPTGVGEPGTPVIAPAVANALSAATGRRFDRLPLRLTT